MAKRKPRKPTKKRPKSDTAVVALRVEEVLRIRLDGAQRHDVCQYASEKGWGVTDRQVDRYIRRADELLVERQDRNRKRVVAVHLAKRAALFARAVSAADYRTALAVADSEAKLRGLFPDREAKELAKIVTDQARQIAELEQRLSVTQPDQATDSGQRPAVGGVA